MFRPILLALLSFPLVAQEFRLAAVAGGLVNPTDIQHAGDGSDRLFVLEQAGRIRIIRGGALLDRPFLDIRDRIASGGERGLLGLAFPPGYADKRYFYVNYTDRSGDTVIARYRTTGDADLADPASETVILRIDQPYANHNGGQIRFGPDGYLYIGMGDGGSGGDPQGYAQNRQALLGKMLRIDTESGASPYAIPPDNPFAGDSSYRPEIWATGLRNPWRFSFDRLTRDLWTADVGQNRAEEVNFQSAASRGGENYGWNRMEGLRCFVPNCDTTGLTLPVHEYPRSEGLSVSGGHVYRGVSVPALLGLYIYGDFGSGRIWGLRRDGGQWVNRLLIASGLSISTFGEDEAGELYVADHDRGGIYQFVPVGDPPPVLTVLSAASFRPGAIAPESIATIFGTGLSSGIESASRVPLPANLAGTSATVTDGRGTPLPASLYFVSPRQINLVVPAGAIAGPATVTVQRADGSNISARAQIARVAPALFSLNASGEGVAAGSVMRLRADGSRSSEDIARLDDSNRTWVVRRVAFGPENEQLILTLYGTGFRLTPQPGAVVARIGGILAPVTFAGAQPEFPGLDQLNIPVPRALDDRGEVDVIITVDGQDSNPVRVGFE